MVNYVTLKSMKEALPYEVPLSGAVLFYPCGGKKGPASSS